jgi:hypothetical protein
MRGSMKQNLRTQWKLSVLSRRTNLFNQENKDLRQEKKLSGRRKKHSDRKTCALGIHALVGLGWIESRRG